MRSSISLICLFLLSGCGLEGAGSAAVAGKQQADAAQQAKETVDTVKAQVGAVMRDAAQNTKRAEDASQ